MHASLPSFVVFGIDPLPVRVEVDCVNANSADTASWSIVGLADAAVRESRERVKAALKNSGYAVAQKRITVNLAPADVRKEGSHLDLAIALAVLASTGRLDAARAGRFAALGELGLDGGLKQVSGALPMAIGARDEGLDGLIVPEENAPEAAYVEGLPVYGVKRLTDAVEFLRGENAIAPTPPRVAEHPADGRTLHQPDMEDVRGQENAKRALEVAAAGGHNLLMLHPKRPNAGGMVLAPYMQLRIPSS